MEMETAMLRHVMEVLESDYEEEDLGWNVLPAGYWIRIMYVCLLFSQEI